MDFIIVPIQPEYAKEEVYSQLTELARNLGMKPNKYVAGTEDEKYSLITEMLSAIIRKELQVVRPTKRAADLPSAPVGCRCFVSIESYNACPVHGTANR